MRITVIAVIAGIAEIARNRKSKPFNHKGHEAHKGALARTADESRDNWAESNLVSRPGSGLTDQ